MTVGAQNRARRSIWERSLPWLLLIAVFHLLIAWPGAATRGVVAEEVQPYLRHYPKLLHTASGGIRFVPPNDDDVLRRAADRGETVTPRWVATTQWPEVGYQGRNRVWPVFVRGHQSAIGTLWGIALGPLLGGGLAGVRRSHVLMGIALLFLTWGIGRRFGLSRAWSTIAALACAASPGLWFFGRSGYGFELASRVVMLLALWLAAPRERLGWSRAAMIGGAFALAVLCRVTIVATLAPVLLLMLSHPDRHAGIARPAAAFGLGVLLPVLLVAIAMITIHFAAAPGSLLPIDRVATRTLAAPAMAWTQLAWVVDGNGVLLPLVDGGMQFSDGWLRPALGVTVAIVAIVRWWHARAKEAERIFVCGLIANALAGAWLYGDPDKFQLGMALEPLFVLAVVQQLADLAQTRRREAILVAIALGAVRGATLVSLAVHEARTDNPMLSSRAQRTLIETIRAEGVPGESILTTTYDHVGMIEGGTDESIRPIHAWRLLIATRVAHTQLVDRWNALLDAHPACRVLLTRAPNLVGGDFTDDRSVREALDQAVAARHGVIADRRLIRGDGGGVVFEWVTLAPCGAAR